jgi:hypothetical protein
MRKGDRFQWGHAQQQAFLQIQQALNHIPVLTFPDPNKELLLRTDASEVGIGAVLISRLSGAPTGQPIGYFAKTLQPPERRWSTRDLEAFAIVSAVRHWQHLLFGLR